MVSNQLCSSCGEIDFGFFANDFQEYTSRSDVTLSRVSSPGCKFCPLIQHCLSKIDRIKQTPQSTVRGVYDGREIQLYVNNIRLEYSIRHCEPTPGIASTSNQSTYTSKRFNPAELVSWLKECKKQKWKCIQSKQDRSASLRHLSKNFRVIDVIERRIVHLEKFEDYVALSYVWGSTGQSGLNISNRKALESKNGLDQIKNLPQTIVDAMNLCLDIGCRYLWVDSLCIIQDSREDKHSQIHSMAGIYSESYLSCFATAGADANAGLPPYGKFSRTSPIESLIIHLDLHGSFVATLSPQIAAESIATSTWASRGWTLQEQALAQRVVFFTGQYTFFRCKHSLWSEDFGLGFSKNLGQFLHWDLPLPPFYRRKSIDGRIYSCNYKHILGAYLTRQLRYPDDILNAITGVLIRLQDHIGEHVWGLPSLRFSVALGWRTNQPFPGDRRPGFPSYSWAGWMHDGPTYASHADVSFHDVYEDSDIEETNQSALTCWRVDEMCQKPELPIESSNPSIISAKLKEAMKREAGLIICSTNSEDIADATDIFRPAPNTAVDFFNNWTTPSTSPLSQHVFIWASCAKLYVDRTSVGTTYTIRTRPKDNVIGAVELRPDWREMQGDQMEFFVTTAGVYQTPDSKPEVKVRIMMIQLEHKGKPPIYTRVQFSHTPISIQGWALARPKSRLIALI